MTIICLKPSIFPENPFGNGLIFQKYVKNTSGFLNYLKICMEIDPLMSKKNEGSEIRLIRKIQENTPQKNQKWFF